MARALRRVGRRERAHVGLRARLAEIEKKWTEAAQLYYRQAQAAGARGGRVREGEAIRRAVAAWKGLLHHPRAARSAPYEAALVHFNYGLAAVRLDADSAEARRALIESQRKLEQVADDFEQARRARARVRLLPDPAQARQGVGAVREPRRGLRQLHPRAARRTTSSSTSCSTTRTSSSSRSSAASSTPPRRCIRKPPRSRRVPGCRTTATTSTRARCTWVRCAEQFVETGVPVQMVENALLAAASQHSAVGDYPAVRDCFEKLAGLELPRAREEAVRRRSRSATAALAAPPVELPGLPGLPEAAARLRRHLVRRSARVGDGRRSVRGRGVDRRRPALSERHPPARARRAPHARRRAGRARPRPTSRRSSRSPSCSASCSRTRRCRRSRSCTRHADPRDPARRGPRAALPLLQALVRDRAQGARRSRSRRSARPRSSRSAACTSRTRSTRSRGSIARAPIRACARRRCSRSARSRRSRPASSSSWCCARRAGALRDAAHAALAQMDNADVVPILRQHHEIETNPKVRETLGELLRRSA